MRKSSAPTTSICRSDAHTIHIRGADLVQELMGELTFTEMLLFLLTGQKKPPAASVKVMDAVLVTLMEHGLTPSAVVARLTYFGAPDSLQSAVAAGLLGVGTTFIGTMEGCAKLIEQLLEAPEGLESKAEAIVRDHYRSKEPLHGFGHPIHKPDDPRSARLIEIAQSVKVPGKHIEALYALSKAADRVYGKHITINATGAVAAVLGEIGVPLKIMRGIAVVSRAAGLVGHILEETQCPAAKHIWETAEHSVPYVATAD